MFSGMNLALFSISRLRLEVEADLGNPDAVKILTMRKDSNFLLTTVLWGNVGINVLLTLLSNSVLAGISAFFFSTVIITIVGEIMPQAYFSRHALRTASMLAPVLKFYQILLYPAAKPTAKILDAWLGAEGIQYYWEHNLREVIKKHIEADESDVDRLEGIGALNFLAIDDLMVVEEGEAVDPRSVITLPSKNNLPVFPNFDRTTSDPFLRKIEISGKKWVIITDTGGEPHLALDSDGFLRDVLFEKAKIMPYRYCHRPIVVKDTRLPLGIVLSRLKSQSQRTGEDVIDRDIILVWGKEEKRVITGADILGRLLKGT
jgi:CBS domain containing-hemolysin-like protein